MRRGAPFLARQGTNPDDFPQFTLGGDRIMPQTLMGLTISALDEFEYIRTFQEVLEICLEQLDNPLDKTLDRVNLLITCYMAGIELHLDELRTSLENLRKQLIADSSPVLRGGKEY